MQVPIVFTLNEESSVVSHLTSSSVSRCARLAWVVITLGWCAAHGAAPAPKAQNQPKVEEKKLPSLAEKTTEAFAKLKPLQDTQDWAGMLKLLDAVPVTPGT